uniref:IQ and AAA domaincontaining protein putative n=1 Tax=Albugo laibachii Nc14 TaxID=890382 RepID=F0WFJ5_9STRA|nr:IQ and AAA domaincontaining protein putative [Albugo laibachii Nc14]|eukprot:CCA19977.1 IQ and AAA domaincontaining protein putative [Albugo laibachii Nc14]
MSNRTYDTRWQEAMTDLNEQIHIENPQFRSNASDTPQDSSVSIARAFHHYAYLYVKYIQILSKLSQCFDQMTHPQKRIDVQQLLQLVAIRMIELKHLLVKWHPPHPDIRSTPIERSFPWEYIHLDAVLVDLKLPPEALEIPIAKCFAEEQLEATQQRDRLVQGFVKLKHGVDAIFLPCDSEAIPQAHEAEAIAILQRNERGRQGRMRGLLVQELRQEDSLRSREVETPDLDPDFAANSIQRVFRGWLLRRQTHSDREKELVFLGMKAPTRNPHALAEKSLANHTLQRETQQQHNKEEYLSALQILHDVVLTEEGPFIKDKLMQERRQWIADRMTLGELPLDMTAFYAPPVIAPPKVVQVAPSKSRKPDPKTKPKAKVPEIVEEEKPPLSAPRELCDGFASAVQMYEKIWLTSDSDENFAQKYDLQLAKDVVRVPVETQVRYQVDEMLILQLANIRMQLETAGKSKKPKAKSKAKPKRSAKKTKGKSLPGEKLSELKGRSPDYFLSALIEHSIVQMPSSAEISDFIGSFNHLGSLYERSDTRDSFGNWVPQEPSAAQIRQNVTEYAILPLTSSIIRSRTPVIRSILLYGPRGCGKTKLVNIIAAQAKAFILNLSPNYLQAFPGKTGPTKLMHMVFSIARQSSFQPIIIYINQFEKFLSGKSQRSGDANRFRKDLQLYLKAALTPQDRVLLIGASSQPFHTDVKDWKLFFDKHLHLSYPDYPARLTLWKRFILSELEASPVFKGTERLPCVLPTLVDFSTLAYISRGYASGSILRAVKATLTPRRLALLDKRPLKDNEFLAPLSREPATFPQENELFQKFTAEISGLTQARERIRKEAEAENDAKATQKPRSSKKK